MESLLQLDEQLFFLLNSEWTNPVLDGLMPFWRSKYFWLPFYIFILAFIFRNFQRNKWLFVIMLGITIVTSDTISSKVIKPAVQRIRPCNQVELVEKVVQRVPCGGGYSFTSSHATNHFALAVFLIFALGRRFRWIPAPLLLWAASISYGQVYVGVHFPLDILGGALLGTMIGTFTGILYRLLPGLETGEDVVSPNY